MHLLPTPRTTASMPLRSAFTVLAIAAATQLAGCSIWPQALTFTAQPKPPKTAPADEAPSPTASPTASPTPASDATAAAVAPRAEPQPVYQPVPPTVSAMPAPEPMATAAAAPAKAAPAAKADHRIGPTKAPAPNKVPVTGLVPGFYVNAGLYAVASNGQNAYKKLEDAGMPVFAESIQGKKGALTRVRVGPYLTRAEATVAANSILGMKLDAAVFKHPK
ncbi:SPOR domain-containing protein [Rhodoferax aquaticus]|uniref:SPOR domain-containing protein n=1 Tax=Rhodoferax aquaticus TaxID=2527691 RepID=A0A515EL55_9BURK|nr:SPOR domain-containing protein [Rhodoferax aquaticus]QDL53349.1 SPOR domain-containing protein [Rhodoferax aquaticus]